MADLYRWTLVKLTQGEAELIAEVTGDQMMVGAGIKGMVGELVNRLNATLTAAGFPPVPPANGGGRRRGRPPKATTEQPATETQPVAPATNAEQVPPVPANAPGGTNPFV